MPRIRTVKPDFFRHEDLQALNAKHRDLMLFFAGLWCQCDKAGRFRWKPNQIRLDVLPFTEYNPSTYLDVLCEAGFISKYTVEGEDYGLVCNFKKHQLIWGSETKSPLRWPEPQEEVQKYVQGSTQDIGVRSQESGDTDRGGKPPRVRFAPPSLQEVQDYCNERKNNLNPKAFIAKYEANGWMVGKNKMKDWKATVRYWETMTFDSKPKNQPANPNSHIPRIVL